MPSLKHRGNNMKRFTLAIGVLLLTGCTRHHLGIGSTVANDDPIIFLVAGQSNGTSGMQGTQGPLESTTQRVIIHDQAGFDGVPSKTNPSQTSITWIYLGDMLAGRHNADITFVNISRGNTSTNQWIANKWYKDIGLKARANNVCAVLWVQGESDAIIGGIDT